MKTITKTNPLSLLLLFGFVLVFSGCEIQETLPQPGPDFYELDLPPGFPAPEIPADNQMTASRVALGKKLFFDPILSRDTTISCGSCHFQENAFAEPKAVSVGIDGRLSTRNAPALFNLAWSNHFFRDGGQPTLELQAKGPIMAEHEMDLNILEAMERLREDPEYVELFWQAYQREPDPFGITRALSAFERTLISGNSPYDQYHFRNQPDALSQQEIRGMELFFSDSLNCSTCHSGFNFSNDDFENNGLYAVYGDTGRARTTGLPENVGKFKVPSLRNVEVTGPYMHDGSVNSLEAVIDHYASGGQGHVNQSPLITGFSLSEQEKMDLLVFLKALTDEEFLNNSTFRQ